MMDKPMELATARHIARLVGIGRAKFGAQYSAPWPAYQIQEALVVINEHANSEAREAISAANRRAGAAEARLKRCMKQSTDLTPDVNNDGLKD